MRRGRAKVPSDAVINSEVEVIGYIASDGSQKYVTWAGSEVPLSTAIGLLELAKVELIRRVQEDA